MARNESAEFSHDEIRRLAYLNWEKDGSPQGRDRDYWLEAECHLKASRHLFASEGKRPVNGKSEPKKSKASGTLKTPACPEPVQRI